MATALFKGQKPAVDFQEIMDDPSDSKCDATVLALSIQPLGIADYDGHHVCLSKRQKKEHVEPCFFNPSG